MTMTPSNDNTPQFKALDNLPLFATDAELAVAIVGTRRAKQWLRDGFPVLATRPGFPSVDVFHGGRSVALVRRYYESYLGITHQPTAVTAGRGEDWSQWSKKKRA